MPLLHRYDFGTAADGERINDYCHFCYDHGQFTQPSLTAAQMVEQSIDFLTSQTLMAKAEARALVTDAIPHLKRWRTAVTQ